MTGTVIRQRFSTANKKAVVVETNPQIDSSFPTRVTPVTALHNNDTYLHLNASMTCLQKLCCYISFIYSVIEPEVLAHMSFRAYFHKLFC